MGDSTQKVAKNWDELRRQAKHIENEIDTKLLSFSKLGSRNSRQQHDDRSSQSDLVPLLKPENETFESISLEIENLLEKLSEVNNRMYLHSQEVQNPSAVYTLSRHVDILNGYTGEFKKIKNSISTQLEREKLLGSVTINELNTSTPSTKRNELYMKEHEHIANSEKLVDEQINVAIRTRETLMTQRTAMKAIKTQMTTLANRFPVINSLVHRINIKKRKDTFIIGSVIGVCLFLFILYKF